MKEQLDIDDYYLGIIIATPEYLHNPKRHRYFGEIDFDPFIESTPMETVLFGVPTLLKRIKKGDKICYTDEYHSRYKNELVYQLHEENSLGIILAHVKPFTECYHEEPTWYTQEEILKKTAEDDNFIFEHTYYICSLKTGEEAIIILNDLPIEAVHNEYFRQLLGEEQFADIASQYEKMVTKMYNSGVEEVITLPNYVQYEWMCRQLSAIQTSNDEQKSLKKEKN